MLGSIASLCQETPCGRHRIASADAPDAEVASGKASTPERRSSIDLEPGVRKDPDAAFGWSGPSLPGASVPFLVLTLRLRTRDVRAAERLTGSIEDGLGREEREEGSFLAAAQDVLDESVPSSGTPAAVRTVASGPGRAGHRLLAPPAGHGSTITIIESPVAPEAPSPTCWRL